MSDGLQGSEPRSQTLNDSHCRKELVLQHLHLGIDLGEILVAATGSGGFGGKGLLLLPMAGRSFFASSLLLGHLRVGGESLCDSLVGGLGGLALLGCLHLFF